MHVLNRRGAGNGTDCQGAAVWQQRVRDTEAGGDLAKMTSDETPCVAAHLSEHIIRTGNANVRIDRNRHMSINDVMTLCAHREKRLCTFQKVSITHNVLLSATCVKGNLLMISTTIQFITK